MKRLARNSDSRKADRFIDVINPLAPAFILYRVKVLIPTVILVPAVFALVVGYPLADWLYLCHRVGDYHSDVQIGQSREMALELASSKGLAHKCLADKCKLDDEDIHRVQLVHCEETVCNKSELVLISDSSFSDMGCTCVLVLSEGAIARKKMAVPDIE
jgi:hypothetical protein